MKNSATYKVLKSKDTRKDVSTIDTILISIGYFVVVWTAISAIVGGIYFIYKKVDAFIKKGKHSKSKNPEKVMADMGGEINE